MQPELSDYKVLVCGPVGSGKTSLVDVLCGGKALSTEVELDPAEAQRLGKKTTTVAVDFGLMHGEHGKHVAIWGVPGQLRFRFMWEAVRDGLVGVLPIVDGAQTGWLQDVEAIMADCEESFPEVPKVLLINKVGRHSEPHLAAAWRLFAERAWAYPVLAGDFRRREQFVLALRGLMIQIRARSA